MERDPRVTALLRILSALLLGGMSSSTAALSPLAASDCIDNTWTAISTDGAPSAREHQAAIWTGSEMIIWGGVGQSGEYLDTGARYDPTTDTWSPVSAVNAPVPIPYPGAVWTGTEMIIWGGNRLGGGRYDPATDTWTAVSTVNAPNGGRSAVWADTEMIDQPSYSPGGRYDPATDTWTVMSTEGAPTNAGSIVWTGTELIVWAFPSPCTGGRYNPTTDTWSAMSCLDGPPNGPQVWTGTEMIVCALGPANRYDPIADAWTRATVIGRPGNRGGHTVVWTGTEMIVWGGVWPDGAPPLDDGSRYDPVADNWRPTSTLPPVPQGRFNHTAVWTGSEMIVWGGVIDQYPPRPLVNTGARYCASTAL
jgi:hypothetical protein